MTENEMIKELYAKECIKTKLATYMRAMDRIDYDLAYSVFKPDATANYVSMPGTTAREVIDNILAAHKTYYYTSHQLSNCIIKIDGCKATSETYAQTFVFCTGENGEVIPTRAAVRYLDKWECVDGEWLIADRQLATDICYMLSSITLLPQSNTSRDKQDISYLYV